VHNCGYAERLPRSAAWTDCLSRCPIIASRLAQCQASHECVIFEIIAVFGSPRAGWLRLEGRATDKQQR
jgi:hypothetical protein